MAAAPDDVDERVLEGLDLAVVALPAADAPPKHSRTVVKPKGKKARADAARERAKAARARPSV